MELSAKRIINIWTDGGARGNPGPAAIGVVVKENNRIAYEMARRIGRSTNNQAEYKAVIVALEWLRSQKITSDQAEIEFRIDSELVVHQLNGQYKVKDEKMKKLHAQVRELILSIGSADFNVVPRSQNKRADQLVNEALDSISRIKHLSH